MVFIFDWLGLAHNLSFFTICISPITYWLYNSNEFYIFVSTAFDLIVDISEVYGSWMVILEITALVASVMIIIQQITVYFTQTNVNTVNFSSNLMCNSLVSDYHFTTSFTLKKLYL